MTTITYNLGEPGTLGLPADDFDGRPMDLAGLALRLVIYRGGDDLILPGYATTGELAVIDGGEINHPSIIAFDFTPAVMLTPRAHPCAVQINDGTGWRTLPGSEFVLNVRNP